VPRFKHVFENGIKFVFKYEEDFPDLLHIYARHLTTIDDALDVFFMTEPEWNEQFQRYENYSETHGIHWFWINKKQKVIMLVSCFRIA
jgi:hypothetical protein